MARPRLEFQALLEQLGAAEVYFQPPNNFRLIYPCIIYSRDDMNMSHANNHPYRVEVRYQVTVIHSDPDNAIKDRVALLPMCAFDRSFQANDLNHDVFNVYF